jgi:hypothetical protein
LLRQDDGCRRRDHADEGLQQYRQRQKRFVRWS